MTLFRSFINANQLNVYIHLLTKLVVMLVTAREINLKNIQLLIYPTLLRRIKK